MLLAQRILAAVLACALLALVACTPGQPPAVADTPDGPAATVRQLADLLRQHDLSGFARAAVPPQDYRTFADAWQQDLSRWPLSELPLPEKIVPMLGALSANDAERQLGQDYDRQLAGQAADLRNAAQTLGLFVGQYVKTQGDFSPSQRAHFGQVIPVLATWAQGAPLADAPRAHTALRTLVAAARATRIDSDADLKAAGMEAALAQLDPFLAAFTGVLSDYGLDLDDSLAKLQTGTVTTKDNLAMVAVTYPLASKPIQLTVTLRQQAGHWYVADYMDQAAELREALQKATPPAPEPEPPVTTPPPSDGKVAQRVGTAVRGHWA
ncbi:hypothetical protein SAMN05428989_3824 [Pseudoxanthomonas sp. GM95]|uniref:hypothetical protein n=1 Tax=Pseudoxanthomonas sp. GM95 TaxID=1881043 RepID=UPI0008D6D7CE|nr:hypothetical protein [Pseudoxanthomonas sp. GM95]SEM42681.1 hypothetical protein SAMN05428989_3824 [Pseudoxanthomonas sp. GM95]